MSSLDATTDLCNLLGDPTRVRLLSLLAREELSVAELTNITDLPQSRVSTHLGKLREAGIVRDRRVGASSFYALSEGTMSESAQELWALVNRSLKDGLLDGDRKRCDALLRARSQPNAWPESIAGEMERHYSPGRTWEATARGLLGFAHFGDVLDVGSGDGAIAALIAPRARSVTCLDRSETVIGAAKQRLKSQKNVHFAIGDMGALALPEQSFDAVLLFNVLTYAVEPERALGEAYRVLRPQGALSLVTLAPHEHEELTRSYGHEKPGFSPRSLRRMLRAAGFQVEQAEITSRERNKPHFEVVSAFATRPAAASGSKKDQD